MALPRAAGSQRCPSIALHIGTTPGSGEAMDGPTGYHRARQPRLLPAHTWSRWHWARSLGKENTHRGLVA